MILFYVRFLIVLSFPVKKVVDVKFGIEASFQLKLLTATLKNKQKKTKTSMRRKLGRDELKENANMTQRPR